MRTRRAAVAVALLAVALLGLTSCRTTSTVESATTTLTVPCGTSGTTVNANWFFPVEIAPRGVVWLQHGFLRSKDAVADLSRAYAARGYAVVAPSFTGFGGCSINTPELRTAVAAVLADSGPSSALQSSANVARALLGRDALVLPSKFVVSGHSAGGALATVVASQIATHPSPAVQDRLAGVVLLDPVESGSAMATALPLLADVPMLTVSAPNSTCNASGSGTAALVAARSGFVGARLATGCHCDAEADTTDALCTFTCGTPSETNKTTLKRLAADWADDMVRGAHADEEVYPGGTWFEEQVTAGVVVPLTGTGS